MIYNFFDNVIALVFIMFVLGTIGIGCDFGGSDAPDDNGPLVEKIAPPMSRTDDPKPYKYEYRDACESECDEQFGGDPESCDCTRCRHTNGAFNYTDHCHDGMITDE